MFEGLLAGIRRGTRYEVDGKPLSRESIRSRVGERFRGARRLNGWDMVETAQRLQIDMVWLTSIESGRCPPRLGTLMRAAEVFGVPTDYLLGVVDEDEPGIEVAERFALARHFEHLLRAQGAQIAEATLTEMHGLQERAAFVQELVLAATNVVESCRTSSALLALKGRKGQSVRGAVDTLDSIATAAHQWLARVERLAARSTPPSTSYPSTFLNLTKDFP